MRRYIHELPEWPEFTWDDAALADPLAALRFRQGLLMGRMESLGLSLQLEATVENVTLDAVRSSRIEGEQLDDDEVRSSVARHLGLDAGGLVPPSRRVEGIVEVLVDATGNYREPLTLDRLFGWHLALFPVPKRGRPTVRPGAFRTDENGPMQVVSGPYGRERVYFQAPAADRLDAEMAAFLAWFNGTSTVDLVVKAALAHLWFVTLHPFEDGNGRLARAIGDMALARADGTSRRFYSLSAQIQQERTAYYRVLESTQSGSLDVTAWLAWFFEMLDAALAHSEAQLGAVMERKAFWDDLEGVPLNARQQAMLRRLQAGFEGKLTASKWAKLTKTSRDTALRDLNDLIDKGVLKRDSAGGRSTSYSLRRVG